MADERNQASWADRALQTAKQLQEWFRERSDPDVAYVNTYDLLRNRGYSTEDAHRLAELGTAGYGRRVGTSKLVGQTAAYMNPVTGPALVARDLTFATTPEEFAGATPSGGLAELGVHAAEAGYEKGKEWLGYSHGGDVERHGYEEGGPPEEPKPSYEPAKIEMPEGYGYDERHLPIEEFEKRHPKYDTTTYPPAPGPTGIENRVAARQRMEGPVFQYEPSKVAGADTIFDRMIQLESGWNHWSKPGVPKMGTSGEVGIAQIMPTTGPIAAAYANLPWDPDRFRSDPNYNLALGRAYFERQLARYGDPVLAAAAYNTGPGNVDRALQRAQASGNPWVSHVHPITQRYVSFISQPQKISRQQAAPPVQVAQATQNDATSEAPPQRYGVFAFGTNDPNPDVALKSAQTLWQQSQRIGVAPVFILPNPQDQRFAPIATALRDFAEKNGIKYEIPVYESKDPLHMTARSAQDIAKKYPDAVVAGDSNSWRIQKYGYNRPVTGPNTFVDPQSEIMLGRVGAGSPEVAKYFSTYADYLQRQNRKEGGRTYPVREHQDWEESLDYEKEGGELTHMSPEKYLDSVEPLEMDDDDKRVIEHFKGQIRKGVKLDPVAIEKSGHPNGRHRAHAAKALGVKSIPVVQWNKRQQKAGGGISYSGDFSTPQYATVYYEGLPKLGPVGQILGRVFPNPTTTGAYDAYMKQLGSQYAVQPVQHNQNIGQQPFTYSSQPATPSNPLAVFHMPEGISAAPMSSTGLAAFNPSSVSGLIGNVPKEPLKAFAPVAQSPSVQEQKKKAGGSVVDRALMLVSTKADRRRGRPD